MAVQVIQQTPTRRLNRRPKHTFLLRHRPWQIQPCMIAPVLPGETLQSLQWQIRAVTDPIRNKLIGWHYESMFFYVKITDLETEVGELTEMFINPVANMSAYNATANTATYHYGGAIDWAARCLVCITDHYFRNEGESPDLTGFHIDNIPVASVGTEGSWLQSMGPTPTVNVNDVNVDQVGAGADIMASEIQKAMAQWHLNQQAGLTRMTFEDYLKSHGLRPPPAEIGKPELLRFSREWTYPSNTVDPLTGTPSSACAWSIQERADKHRMFREPGFIFGVVVCRPKIYLQNQSGSVSALLDNGLFWLPALLRNDITASIVNIDNADAGPLTGQTTDYTIDLKDLWLHGDQFVNFGLTATDSHLIGLPTAAGVTRYASAADADELFVSGATNKIRADGVVQLSIMGNLSETSP